MVARFLQRLASHEERFVSAISGSTGSSGVAGELRIGNDSTDSHVRVNIDGAADMKIVLEGMAGLSVGDFQF